MTASRRDEKHRQHAASPRSANDKHTRKIEESVIGRILPWHRIALHAIWTARPCVPSVTSRRAWAAARHIAPMHVHNYFANRKSKAKKKGEPNDLENEGYELDVAEGGLTEVITRNGVKEEELPSHLAQNADDRLGIVEPVVDNDSKLLGPVKMALTPRPQNVYSTPSGTPDLAASNDIRVFPLTPRQNSSPIFGNSFYSPPALLISSSASLSSSIRDYSSTPLLRCYPSFKRVKRKDLEAYTEPAWIRRKKRRLLDLPSTPSLIPSMTKSARTTPRDRRVLDLSAAQTPAVTKLMKREILEDNNLLPPATDNCSAVTIERVEKRKIVEDSRDLRSAFSDSTFAPSAFALSPWSAFASSPAAFSSSAPASSPMLFSSPVLAAHTTHTQQPNRKNHVVTPFTAPSTGLEAVHRRYHGKDRLCVIDNADEVFLPRNQEHIWRSQELQPPSQQGASQIYPRYPQPTYPLVGVYDNKYRKPELNSTGLSNAQITSLDDLSCLPFHGWLQSKGFGN